MEMNRRLFGILILLAWTFLLVAPVYADRDDFNSAELDPAWIWDNPADDSSYDLAEEPGWLKITCGAGDHDIWDVRGGGPAVLLEAPEDYTVETHWLLDAPSNTAIAIVFFNEDAVGNANSPGPWCLLWCTKAHAMYVQHAIGTGWGDGLTPEGDVLYVKVEKSGDNWKFSFKSEEDDDWELFVDDDYDIGGKHYVGMSVYNWGGVAEASGFFDYFETSWTFTAVEPADKLMATWAKIRAIR